MTSRRPPQAPSSHWASPPRLRFAASAPHGHDVSISVTDTTDLVLPGVTVEARDAAGGGMNFADGTSQYAFRGPPPGNLRAHLLAGAGFNAAARVVKVAAGDIADLMSV